MKTCNAWGCENVISENEEMCPECNDLYALIEKNHARVFIMCISIQAKKDRERYGSDEDSV
jgi:hypothetical protein